MKRREFLSMVIAAGSTLLIDQELLVAEQEKPKIFFAFSLKAAERRIRNTPGSPEKAVALCGHLTRLVGLIVDPNTKDCILIGERDASLPQLHLDDLIVMIRSVFLHKDTEAPGVTMEPDRDDPQLGTQNIRYFGHIQGTRVGWVCFAADFLMKKIGLGLEPPGVPGIRTYFEMAVEEARQHPLEKTEVLSRFWYYPVVSRVVSVGNGVLLDRCELAVLTEVLSAKVKGQQVEDVHSFYDKPSEVFAQSFSDHFNELAEASPVIADLRNLTVLAALSRGLAKTDVRPELDYWLYNYQLPSWDTPKEAYVLRNEDRTVGFEVYGGVHLQALSIRLKEGDLTAFSEAALKARPSSDRLIWPVVLTSDRQIFIPTLAGDAEAASVAEVYARADYLFRARKYDLAIACWRDVARSYPQMGEVYYRIGLAFEKKGMLACAADYYSKAIQLDPFLRNVGFCEKY